MPSPGIAKLLQAIHEYTPEEGGDELIWLRRAIDRLELTFSAYAGQFAGTTEWDGYGSPIEFLRYEAKMPSGVAADRIRIGMYFEDLTHSVNAVHRGEIGLGHLAALAHTADWLENRDRDFDERRLLKKASEQSVTRFRRTCDHYRHREDPKEFGREEAQGREMRYLELNPAEDGSLHVRGWFEPEAAAVVRSAIEPLARKVDKHDHRRREQRLADALVEQLSSNQETELLITCPLETLLGVAGAPAAETEWGGLLSRYAIERLATCSWLRRVVLDGKSVVIDMGRRQRVVTSNQRKALVARDGCCAVPGCDRPPRFAAGHHLVLWSEGGGTNLKELAMVCWHHHHQIHDYGYQLVRDGDGSYRLIPPVPPSWPLDPPAA